MKDRPAREKLPFLLEARFKGRQIILQKSRFLAFRDGAALLKPYSRVYRTFCFGLLVLRHNDSQMRMSSKCVDFCSSSFSFSLLFSGFAGGDWSLLPCLLPRSRVVFSSCGPVTLSTLPMSSTMGP